VRPAEVRDGVRRFHIIGGPGSGKTTLAERIGARRGIPAYDLDCVAYENGAGAERPLAERGADVQRILAQPGWVTEGIYLGWITPLLAAAEVIVWLDLPWHVAARRIVTRHAKRSLAGTNKHRGLVKLARFVGWSRDYYTATSYPPPLTPEDDPGCRAAVADALSAYADKVAHLRSPREVAAFLRSLEA
jgi:hypothetical protein